MHIAMQRPSRGRAEDEQRRNIARKRTSVARHAARRKEEMSSQRWDIFLNGWVQALTPRKMS